MIVAGFIASLKVAVTTVLGQTLVAPLGGLQKSRWVERKGCYLL
ncbi:MAG: hypothetical protein WAN09_12295 [Candidatus Korobacteraceae bacterium]